MKARNFEISGRIADVVAGTIRPGTLVVVDGKIDKIRYEEVGEQVTILPGLIDAHIHIESSMLVPSEFARLAVLHGTVATVSDPHEIANVLGIAGVEFMIENGRQTPFKFNFGAPSCVPATPFETSGARLGIEEISNLLERPEIKYLSEMMNFPGVLFEDAEVMAKLALARHLGKPVDGHAPGVIGADAEKYIGAGITTDHECFTIEEAKEKISYGMSILIREGSAAKNFDALIPLIKEFPDRIMLCSDDKHPDDLLRGHINILVKRALSLGYDFMSVIRCCTLNPVKHYSLDTGLLQPGDPADFIVIDSPEDFNVQKTFINGELVAESGISLLSSLSIENINAFDARPIVPSDLEILATGDEMLVMKALEGQLITEKLKITPTVRNGLAISDPERDLIKIVVLNRYQPSAPAVGFITNTGLKRGALASSVAHDSHNIVAIGADDESLSEAINMIIATQGGISLCSDERKEVLPLPVAGIMTGEDGFTAAGKYEHIDALAKELGFTLSAPYMTLSFMALLVIPELKLSDKGLFDGLSFSFTSLFPQ